MAAILAAVSGVDRVAGSGISVLEYDVLLDATGVDAPLVTNLNATKPSGGTPVGGSDVKIATDARDPDDHRLSQRSVASERGDRQFVRASSSLVHVVIGTLSPK